MRVPSRRPRCLLLLFALLPLAASATTLAGLWRALPGAERVALAAQAPGGVWQPAPGTSWQWQLTTPVDRSVDAAIYDIDLFDNDASVVAALHAQGREVICYLSAGTWENWRPDAGRFPAAVRGSSNGWPGERWLDIRRLDVLGPIMEARLDLCKTKGFDGVEADNVDGYANRTGFPLTYQDQLTYNRYLAGAAHARGLSIGLKNDLDQVRDLVSSFDWALNEQCFQYNECQLLTPFISAGKAVFQVEYSLSTSQFCPQALAMGFSSMRKRQALDAYREPCAAVGGPPPTPSRTATPRPSATPTNGTGPTATNTPSPTATPTASATPPTRTATASLTPRATTTASPTASATPPPARTSTATPSRTPTAAPARTATPTIAPSSTPTPGSSSIWRPALNTSWQIQLTGTIDQSVNATMYDIDGFDNTASVVAALHARGRKVICYFSAGSWENWRPDAGAFPAAVKGKSNGWPGEQWLDIRRLDVLGPIMDARLDMCKAKGFDGVDPDNVDGYTNDTGFPLTYQDQLTYNRYLASAAHARGLSVGLKNDLEQVADLVSSFDWQINEQCFQYNECDALLPFINAGKPVFQIEYSLSTSQFCARANSLNFNSLLKHLSLDAYRVACR